MSRIFRLVTGLLLVAGALLAADPPGVEGKWALTLDTPHGAVSMELVLKQDRSKVSGTMSTPSMSNVPLSGEFANGALTCSTSPQGSGAEPLELRGRLLEDGTLSGHVSSSRGDAKFTGRRAADKAK